MRVLALGGAGAVGAAAARLAAALPGVRRIEVADRDLAAAHRLAGQIRANGTPAQARRVDIGDPTALRAALTDADVVLNTAGPFYRHGPTVLRAAIDTGTHYLDVCDDGEPTLDMLDLDGAARAAGVRAVVGVGASPGLSNLLAARAVRDLDAVHDLHTAWPVDVPRAPGRAAGTPLGPPARPGAALLHWMHQISGEIPVVEDGVGRRRPPLRPVTLRLPGGRRGTAYTVGHPEPLTLGRSYRPTGHATTLMVVTPTTAAYLDVLRRDLDAGRLTPATAAAALAAPSARRMARSLRRLHRFAGPRSLPPFFAVATGTRRGRRRTVLAHLPGASAFLAHDMATATAVPLALGLAQLLDGIPAAPGVRPPETALDVDRFLTDLARHVPGRGGVVVEHRDG
ncbi:saccharopine dehydrogenase family protein [Streptoalloteichus hindustanus]|uniref:Saccharopine dehydrogenase, NADP-dependent n=1 Tax=Streptoalloteichus hindustanus TaxID=2017 RepID=A0A1M5DLG3_STRHI|nr:saccharopine dehydrogenase NADP-binding domain-containing protein [Streptoalloteichus hindustanus]SHF67839.1 Saccharopine dehydrogenase, NADP-dependent [Streptoalloteichus hindustanus]